MTIEKGRPWGRAGTLPDGGVLAHTDAEVAARLEVARTAGEPFPVVGLLGGDLCRTLGGLGDEGRMRGRDAMTFTVDVGEAVIEGHSHLFVAHLLTHTRLWGRTAIAMNAQWMGPWNVGPKAHPSDGLLDVYEATLPAAERLKVRARLPLGAHLPHPGIRASRSRGTVLELGRPRPIRLDHRTVASASSVAIRVLPDALTIVV